MHPQRILVLGDFEGFEPDNGEVSSYEDLVSDMQGSSDEEEVVEIVTVAELAKGIVHSIPGPGNHTLVNKNCSLQKGGIAPWGMLLVGRVKEKLVQLGTPKKESLPNPPRQKRLFEELSSHANDSAKRVCLAKTVVDPESDCLLTPVEPSQDIVMNPPKKEWKK